MDDHFSSVAEAFSRKANKYDAFGQGHANLTRMRQKVYARIESVVPPGSRLLELNAGTGADAVAMVEKGFQVHATDLSGGMVAEIGRKIGSLGLAERLTAQQCSFTELASISGGPYEGIYSNFGGLNCIDDLRTVTRELPRLLRPHGAVVLVIMPRVCPWELAHFFKDPKTATRRLRRGSQEANVEGVRFLTTYFSVKEAADAFAPAFRQEHVEALSLVTPTADNKRFAVRHPRLFRGLVQLDELLSPLPLIRGWGDFFILTMRYLGGQESRGA